MGFTTAGNSFSSSLYSIPSTLSVYGKSFGTLKNHFTLSPAFNTSLSFLSVNPHQVTNLNFQV